MFTKCPHWLNPLVHAGTPINFEKNEEYSQWRGNVFRTGGNRKYKICFVLPQNCQSSALASNFNGDQGLTHSLVVSLEGGMGTKPPAAGSKGIRGQSLQRLAIF